MLSKEEIYEFVKKLCDYDFERVTKLFKCKKKPVFNLDLFKRYYALIAEYPYLPDESFFGKPSIFSVGYSSGILTHYEIGEIKSSPFNNLVSKYCMDYNRYLWYKHFYYEKDPKFICPFTDKICVTEEDCFDKIFIKIHVYRYTVQQAVGSSDFFLESCRKNKIFPSVPYIENEITKMAMELVNNFPIRKNVLVKDSLEYFKSIGFIKEEKDENNL